MDERMGPTVTYERKASCGGCKYHSTKSVRMRGGHDFEYVEVHFCEDRGAPQQIPAETPESCSYLKLADTLSLTHFLERL